MSALNKALKTQGPVRGQTWIKLRVSEHNTPISNFEHALGLSIIILARLSPLFPFAMLSFVFGATSVSTSDYLIGHKSQNFSRTLKFEKYFFSALLARLPKHILFGTM